MGKLASCRGSATIRGGAGDRVLSSPFRRERRFRDPVYIGYLGGGIATTGYNAQIDDFLWGRQFVARAVFWREREA
jgi:hypothetical protein